MGYLLVMNVRLPLLLFTALLTACGDDDVIVNKAPFQNLICRRLSWDQLKLRSATFARAQNFRYGSTEYSVLITNKRLNFILARVPDTGRINATAIARSEPSSDETKLFRRFVSNFHLDCVQATN